ncbi:hypothetical protein LXL04_021316 [Taraxacum kok-saghyz]
MEILSFSSKIQNLKRYLKKKKKRTQENNGTNAKKMKTVRLGGGGGGGTTNHEASLMMDLENGRSSSSRLKAFPMASSRLGTQEIVDGNYVVEIYKRMVSTRDPLLDSSHL